MKILKAHNLDVTYTYNIDVEKNNCIKYFFWFWNVIDVKLADDMLNMKAPMIPLFFLNQIPYILIPSFPFSVEYVSMVFKFAWRCKLVYSYIITFDY